MKRPSFSVLSRLSGRTPLRIKLVLIMSGLVTVALALTALAATTAMRHYLVNRVDTQLKTAAAQIIDQVSHDGPNGSDFPQRPNDLHDVSATDNCGASSPQQAAGDPNSDEQPATGATGAASTRPLLPSVYFVEVDNPQGVPTGQNSNPVNGCSSWPALPHLTPQQAQALGGQPFTVPSAKGSGSWRVVAAALPGGNTVSVATSLSDVSSTLHTLELFELTIGAAVLLVLGGLAYVAVRRSLRPLLDVEATAEAIAAGDLSSRIPAGDARTEVGRLSVALNGMLAQIESAFRAREISEQEARTSEQRMRRFITDAGHELRTPLTSIRGFSELYRLGAVEDRSDVDRVMGRIEGESARMSLLVDDLLLLARLDQHRPLEQAIVDVAAIVNDAALDARAVAPGRDIRLDTADDHGDLVVVGDEARLRQVVGNLVGNAIAHTPPEASITLRLRSEHDLASDGADASAGAGPSGAGPSDADRRWIVIEVADTGQGMQPDDAARIFERFYRVEQSRNRSSGGTGLGLSIVAALVEAHGGTVTVDTAPGAGATFTVRLPAATSAGEEA
jgi:two-component system OmpR family sensor kinase